MAQEADVLGHLAAGQLAPLARLGALRHLDLDLVGRRQVFRRDAEAAGRDLLDPRAQRVALIQRVIDLDHFPADDVGDGLAPRDRNAFELLPIARRVFAALARIALSAD